MRVFSSLTHLTLLFSFSLTAFLGDPRTASAEVSASPKFDQHSDGFTLGSVKVSRQTAQLPSTNYYLITDRKLEELQTQYTEALLNPMELHGKRILDLGTGGGSLVTSMRNYGTFLCRRGDTLLRDATKRRVEAKKHKQEGENAEVLGMLLKSAGQALLQKGISARGVCELGDAFCELAKEQKNMGEGLCTLAEEMEDKVKKMSEAEKNRNGAFADAHGIDLVLPPHLKKSPFFKEGDALKTGYDSNSFDALFSSYSLFSYEARNKELMRGALQEAFRILKPGGTLAISPIVAQDLPVFKEALKNIPGFVISKGETTPVYTYGRKTIAPRPGDNFEKGVLINIELRKEETSQQDVGLRSMPSSAKRGKD